MENSIDTEVVTTTTTKTVVKEPSLYDVVFYNDNKTPYDFVILVLMHLFAKTYEKSYELAQSIHTNGRGAVDTFTYEIATTKRDETIATARANGHPLRVEVEPSSVSPND